MFASGQVSDLAAHISNDHTELLQTHGDDQTRHEETVGNVHKETETTLIDGLKVPAGNIVINPVQTFNSKTNNFNTT